ncbi:MAG: prenyltransferase/squalene oxidase repeat-containing protein [bacterium]
MRSSKEKQPKANQPSADDTIGIPIVSRRAVLIGLALTALVVLVMVLWRMASNIKVEKEPAQFDFTVEEPRKEEFELQQQARPMSRAAAAQEVIYVVDDNAADAVPYVKPSDRPDIQVALAPVMINNTAEVSIDFRAIDPTHFSAQALGGSSLVEVDAGEGISDMEGVGGGEGSGGGGAGGGSGEGGEVVETVSLVMDTMLNGLPGASDIFKYAMPGAVSQRQRMYTWIRGFRNERAMNALPQIFGEPERLVAGALGQMNVSMFGAGEFLRAMTRMGGVQARTSVDSALQWLAARQEKDGHWEPKKFDGNGSTVGSSGLALMAFMGGGHTARRGDHRRQVTRGMLWLLAQQRPDGSVGVNMREHAIATIAFCEAFGRAQDERMQTAARRAVDFIQKARLQDGGWGYQRDSQNSDILQTAWVVQALKAARLAQISFDQGMHSQALLFLDSVTDKGAGEGTSGAVNGGPLMTCAAMVARQLSGVAVRSEILKKGAALTRATEPDWRRKDFNQWYFATYAMHNMGEEDRIWWNKRMRDVLIDHQSRQGDTTGSWDPKGDMTLTTGGGRIEATALGALCLEVYYRYSDALNAFGVAPDIDDLLAR